MTKYYFTLLGVKTGHSMLDHVQICKKREDEHNLGKAAKYTKGRRPVTIVYFEGFRTLPEARRREKQVKGWRREKKEGLCLYGHPKKIV